MSESDSIRTELLFPITYCDDGDVANGDKLEQARPQSPRSDTLWNTGSQYVSRPHLNSGEPSGIYGLDKDWATRHAWQDESYYEDNKTRIRQYPDVINLGHDNEEDDQITVRQYPDDIDLGPYEYTQGSVASHNQPGQEMRTWQAGWLNLTATIPPESVSELQKVPTLKDIRQAEGDPGPWSHWFVAQYEDQDYPNKKVHSGDLDQFRQYGNTPKEPWGRYESLGFPSSKIEPSVPALSYGPSQNSTSVTSFSSKHMATSSKADKYALSRCPSPTRSTVSITPSNLPDVLLCEKEGCRAVFRGKYRLGTMQRHMRHKHSVHQRIYNCENPGCDKSFQRSDARLKHHRSHHQPILDSLSYTWNDHKMTELTRIVERQETIAGSLTGGEDARSGVDDFHEIEDEDKPDRDSLGSVVPQEVSDVLESPKSIRDDAALEESESTVERKREHVSNGIEFVNELVIKELPQSSPDNDRERAGPQNSEILPISLRGLPYLLAALAIRRLDSRTRYATSAQLQSGDESSSATDSEHEDTGDFSNFATDNGGTENNAGFAARDEEAGNTSGSGSSQGKTAGSKRSWGGPPDNNDNDKKRKRRSRYQNNGDEPDNEMYACPFPKNDPINHHRCFDFVFNKKKFGHLKDHFKRVHLNPVHCPRCGNDFHGDNKHAELQRHSLQCMEVNLIRQWNGITADQWEKIKKSKPRGLDEFDHYMDVNRILFDGKHPLSEHPYLEDYWALAARIFQNRLAGNITSNLVNSISALLEQRDDSGVRNDTAHEPNGAPGEVSRLVETAVNAAFATAANNQTRASHLLQETSRSTPCLTSDSGFVSLQETLPSYPGPNSDTGFVASHPERNSTDGKAYQSSAQTSASPSLQDVRGFTLDAAGIPSRHGEGESLKACEDDTAYCGTPQDIMADSSLDFSLHGPTSMTELDIVNALQQGMPTMGSEYIDGDAIGNPTDQAHSLTLDQPMSPTAEFLTFLDEESATRERT